MLKKLITYTDYNGQEQKEEFYFNYTKAELVQLEMSTEGGLKDKLEKIVASKDGKLIMEQFREIILGSYGRRSPDGKRFIKTAELREEFETSEAYSELFMEIVTDPGAAAEFVSGLMPQDLMKKVQMELGEEAEVGIEGVDDLKPGDEQEAPRPQEARIITVAESREMDPAQLAAGLGSGALKIRLNPADVKEMDPDDLTSGLTTGQYVFINEG